MIGLVLLPDYYVYRIWTIQPEWLIAHKIKVLLLDVDNTLTKHNSPEVPVEVRRWLEIMKDAGIRLLILSNNRAKRVAPFAEKLGLDYIANAAKPLGFSLRHALKRLEANACSTALVGDQLFTDVLSAKHAGITSILVKPLEKEPFLFLRFKRYLEQIILKEYCRKEHL